MKHQPGGTWGPETIWESPQEFFNATSVPDGVNRIIIKGTLENPEASLDFYFFQRNGSVLLTHFYGAKTNRSDDGLTFSGKAVSEEVGSSYLLFHDPALSLDLKFSLGWYAGIANFNAPLLIQKVITFLSGLCNAPRVVLWGGSGGGFASLRIASALTNAWCFVWNPQTSIYDYHEQNVIRYSRLAFGKERLREQRDIDPNFVFSLEEVDSLELQLPKVVYLQETSDWHVSSHLLPYLGWLNVPNALEITLRDSYIGSPADNLYLHKSTWYPGHNPPHKDIIIGFLHTMADLSLSWDESKDHFLKVSRKLLHSARLDHRGPMQLQSVGDQACEPRRLVVAANRLALSALEQCADEALDLVSFISPASVVSAFSINPTIRPTFRFNTKWKLQSTHKGYIDDLECKFSQVVKESSEWDYLIWDPIEEIQGIISIEGGTVLTNREQVVDLVDIKHTLFNPLMDSYEGLLDSRLSRFKKSIVAQEKLVILEYDVSKFTDQDWKILGLNPPSSDSLALHQNFLERIRLEFPDAQFLRTKSSSFSEIRDELADLFRILFRG